MRTPLGTRELAVGAGVVILLSRFVDTPVAWALSLLLLGAVAFGALQLMGEADPAGRSRGVPIESLIDPAVLTFAAVGVLQLVPVGLLLIPALAAILYALLRDLGIETRLAHATTPPSAADRTAVLSMTILIGLAAFLAVAALVPGALPDAAATTGDAGGATGPATNPSLVLGLAAVDGLIAFLLAYRVAALRSSSIRDVGWAASMAAGVVAIAAAGLRALEIPGILGPALLVLVFFLWEAMHGGAPARRRDPRRLWETALLLALGVVVVVWALGLRA
ncbi:MAG TPA: hypothetical protein VNH13_07930 [Candidatus Acidoferrales bacterium]|nr:hypothetical protein [Candidatus Acidoferrales bacterium]